MNVNHNNNRVYAPRQRSYEEVLTNSENKHMAIEIVDKFLTMIRSRKSVGLRVQSERQSAATFTRNIGSLGSELDSINEDHVRNIFEKINEIKQASSGWFGCGRVSDGGLGKLHQELDGQILAAYDTFTPDMKKKLLLLPKPNVKVAMNDANDDTPLLSAKGQSLTDICRLKNAFDIVMRNDSRVFQVTIPKALAMLYNKYKKVEWKTAFIEKNISYSSKYNLPSQVELKRYPNSFVERHLAETACGKVELVYVLINPIKSGESICFANKYMSRVTGKNLHTSSRVGNGKFGSIYVYRLQPNQSLENDDTNYAKKKYNETRSDQNHRSEEHKSVQYRHSYYTACLQFKLQIHENLKERVKLNHPVAWNIENGKVAKAIAQVADGEALSRGEFTSNQNIFIQALNLTTMLHRCGAFALDNKPNNYMKCKDYLTRVDLDLDAQAAIHLNETVEFCGNIIECPGGKLEGLANMYAELEKCQEDVDKAVVRADFYRGQSLAGLVLCSTEGCFKNCENGTIFVEDKEDGLRQLLKKNLPSDVSPHNRDELIEFVVNWHFNIKHKEIAEFLTNYRVKNKLMDPIEHLPTLNY